jgi:hypothetical protein
MKKTILGSMLALAFATLGFAARTGADSGWTADTQPSGVYSLQGDNITGILSYEKVAGSANQTDEYDLNISAFVGSKPVYYGTRLGKPGDDGVLKYKGSDRCELTIKFGKKTVGAVQIKAAVIVSAAGKGCVSVDGAVTNLLPLVGKRFILGKAY